jgi:hypothetical protein
MAAILVVVVSRDGALGRVAARTSNSRQTDHLMVDKSSGCPRQVAAKYGIVAKLTHSGEQVESTLTAHGVAALAAQNVWVAGEAVSTKSISGTINTWGTVSMIEHWDGRRWCLAANTIWPGATFNSIVATDPNNAWAVGEQPQGNIRAGRPLIEHWDGRGWTIFSPTVPGANFSILQSVAASSPTNVWVVGVSVRQVVEHWNGRSWQSVPLGLSTREQQNTSLNAVATLSPTDTWVVGNNDLALHWDGTRWQITPLPPVTNPFRVESLQAVAALSPHNVWAVGAYKTFNRSGGGPVAYHWDGTVWQRVAVPNEPGAAHDDLGGWPLGALAAVSPTDIWALNQAAHALHWDGRGWHIIASPGSPQYGVLVSAASAVSTSDVWAVGPYSLTASHWDGQRWSPVSIAPAG